VRGVFIRKSASLGRQALVAAWASSLASAALFVAFAIFVLRPGPAEWSGIVRVALALSVGVPVLIAVLGIPAGRALRRLRLAPSVGASGQPLRTDLPALLQIHRAPLSVALPVFVIATSAALADTTGLLPWSGIHGPRALAVGFAAVGTLQLGLHASVLVWRDLIWTELSALPPRSLSLQVHGTLAHRLVLRVVSVAGFVVAWAVAAFFVAAGHFPHLVPAALVVGVVAYGALLVVLVVSYRLGRHVVADVRRLTAFVDALRSNEEWTATGELPLLGRPLSTQPAEALNQAIVAVAERFARMANEEARVRGVLERAERLRPRFMAWVSHDLRGPLNSIKGFAEILSRGEDPPLSPEQRESLMTIQESGEELLRLVTEIIDATRLLEGRIELHLGWTPIVTLLTEAIGQVRLLRRRRPVELETNLQPGLPVLKVDRARLVQALVSVLAFVQHPLEQGSVHVGVRVIDPRPERRGLVRFEIRASPGVDLGDGKHLFEALRPERGPSGQRVAGLGVGLFLARGLVERHGGALGYHPGLQQSGGTFVLDLPITSEAA